MVKKLTRTGNSFALVLERPLLEATGIEADTPLEVSTDGDVILITPVRDRSRPASAASTAGAPGGAARERAGHPASFFVHDLRPTTCRPTWREPHDRAMPHLRRATRRL